MKSLSPQMIARALFEESKGKDHKAIDELTGNTVKLLAKEQLLKDSDSVLKELERLEDMEGKVIRAEVESKGSLGEHEKKEIEDFIHKKFPHHHVSLIHKDNKDILGGVKIRIEDEVWDLTIDRELKRLKNYLVSE